VWQIEGASPLTRDLWTNTVQIGGMAIWQSVGGCTKVWD
jgi:hypothetical protein